jgi:hydroxypyruvate isomerase
MNAPLRKTASMPKFAANLSFMFSEWDFLDRFAAAADSGFHYVEYLFPYDHAPEVIASRLRQNKLQQVLFNVYPGNWDQGDRGLAALPGRRDDFLKSVNQALIYAEALSVSRLHLMAGAAGPYDRGAAESYRDAIALACDRAAEKNITILIEPINSRDMPGYFLNRFDQAADIINQLARPNLKLQFDVYHRQIIHGDVQTGIKSLLPLIGHVQIAAVPARHEPGSGELDDFRILRYLDELGYDGYVGLEYRPENGTLAGLDWLARFNAG